MSVAEAIQSVVLGMLSWADSDTGSIGTASRQSRTPEPHWTWPKSPEHRPIATHTHTHAHKNTHSMHAHIHIYTYTFYFGMAFADYGVTISR